MRGSIALAMAFILLLLVGCGSSGKYADFIALMRQYNQARTDFSATVKDTTDPAKLAPACRTFAADLNRIGPKMTGMRKKYPELKGLKDWPAELAVLRDETIAAEAVFGPALSAVVKQANRAGDNQPFQEAFGTLNQAVWKLR